MKNKNALKESMERKKFKVGDIVVFKKLVKGHWQGVEKQPYLVVETNLKHGEVDILVKNLKTNEAIYTNTRILEYSQDRVAVQLSLFDFD